MCALWLQIYVKLKLLSAKITKTSPNWDGPHLCHLALDRLANYVNEGVLQTVVDQVIEFEVKKTRQDRWNFFSTKTNLNVKLFVSKVTLVYCFRFLPIFVFARPTV